MGRRPCCSKELVLNRGAWTAMEDKILSDYILAHGEGKWRHLPERAGLKRCGKSCRLRWLNYLRPGIKRGSISEEEEDLILRLHKLLGNRWALIAGRLPGRTDNEIKNYWHTKLGKANNITIAKPCSDDQSGDDPISEPTASAKKQRVCEPRITTTSTVVRTKATRFSKPVMVPLSETGPIITHVFDRTTTDSPELSSLEDSGRLLGSSNFEMDFDVDQSFLSDFLNSTDDWISEPPYSSDADQANISSSTLTSDQNLLLSSDETVLPRGHLELDSIADDQLEDWFLI